MLVGNFGFLESSDEACNFIKIVTLGARGVKRASRAVIRFHNSLWSSDFWAFDPGIFPWGGSGEVFRLCNPRLLGSFGDRFGSFLRPCWGKVKQVLSIMFMNVVTNTGSNSRIVGG